VSRAVVGRTSAGKQGAEARRERSRGLIGKQGTPSLGTWRIHHQRKVNRLVGQHSVDGSAQGVRGEFVLLARPAIRRCELGDAGQLERRKTIGCGYRVEVVY